MTKAFLLAVLFVSCTTIVFAQDGRASSHTTNARFRLANAAYAENRFTDARASYRELVELGVEDPGLYYNLGLAEAHLGEHGRAIAALENSLRLGGRSPDALAALESVRGQLGAQRAERQGEATVSGGESFFELIFGFAQRSTFAWLALLGVMIGTLGAFMLRFGMVRVAAPRRDNVALILSIATTLAFALACFSLLGVLTLRGAFHPGRDAVVIGDTHLIEAPSANAAERAEALAGERAFVVGEYGSYFRVRIDGAREGWIARENITPLLAYR